jgi:cell division GTPase FtsZ
MGATQRPNPNEQQNEQQEEPQQEEPQQEEPQQEEQQQEEQIKSLYGEAEVDISLPEIPMPEPEPEKKTEIKDEIDAAFNFAFIGAGQGGSRIAETFYALGYRKVAAINTAMQDLNTLKLIENKLCIGDGGAGKDPKVAEELFNRKAEDVLDFMKYSFGEELDRVIVSLGAGGGSGAGMMEPLVYAAKELQESVKASAKQVGVILALPKASEGRRVNANAHNTLKKAFDLVDKGIVSPLIILDNEKITKLYPNLVVSNFWQTANMSMAGLFNLFNLTSSKDSSYSAFDKKDYETLLDSGCIVFGASPVADWKDSVSISRAVRENLKNNLLSGGLDLSSGTCAAAVVVGGKEQLDNIPQKDLDQAFEQLSRMLKPGNVVHNGIYSGNKPNLTVFTAVGGLARPTLKLEELAKLGDL